MIIAFGMPSIGSLIFIVVVVFAFFATRRLRTAGKNSGVLMKTLVPLGLGKKNVK
ncbi:MAG: hypothetical protein KAG20_03990 [Cocleimonas sp.]|nr:hypothetical protein [Cocleimonas sp.]